VPHGWSNVYQGKGANILARIVWGEILASVCRQALLGVYVLNALFEDIQRHISFFFGDDQGRA
jgi:hypothetical protein